MLYPRPPTVLPGCLLPVADISVQVLTLSEALNYELRATGVAVTTLCPGPVATEFFEVSGSKKAIIAKMPIILDSPFVAAAGVRAMFAGRPLVIPGISMKLMQVVAAMMPRLFATWLNAVVWSHI
jgi:short-subunit dehydrogenase